MGDLNDEVETVFSDAEFARLLRLTRAARQAADEIELAFMAVNDSRSLVPYRQSVLWLASEGVKTLSGVVRPDLNAPYTQWLSTVCEWVCASGGKPRPLFARQLPEEISLDWGYWLPAYGFWVPLVDEVGNTSKPYGGLLYASDLQWSDSDKALLVEWVSAWSQAWICCKAKQDRLSVRGLLHQLRVQWVNLSDRTFWTRRKVIVSAIVAMGLFCPIRLTVLAPGELVPVNPAVVRAPFEGVVATFQVKPNEVVRAGQPLFSFETALLQSKLEVARQSLYGAEAEYRQASQLALSDPKYKGQLAVLASKVDERRAEAEFLAGQLDRAQVLAPKDGVALFDDPSEWVGKPVNTGEKIMRIAVVNEVEVEAWVSLGDAIPVQADAPVRLYLSASPFSPLAAKLRYVAHDAVARPDGSYAYRLRATLDGKSDHLVGLKGTAKISGEWVPFIYWVLRKPVAAIRQAIGW